MAEDIHDYEQRLESVLENIQQKKECTECGKKIKEEECPDCSSTNLQHLIGEKNRELAQDFNRYLGLRDMGKTRQYRYMISIKKIMEYNDFRLDDLKEDEETKDKIYEILLQIKNSEYQSKEYSKRTKQEFKSVLVRLLEYHDLETDSKDTILLPDNFKSHVSKKEMDLTDPEALPTPSDVKKLCRKLEVQSPQGVGIRNASILLTTWETMARIGAILNIKLGDVIFKDQVTEITIPGIKDRYLFVKLTGEHKEEQIGYKGYTKNLRKAYKRLQDQLVWDLEGQTNHISRKARRTYCHRAELMPPEMIKKMGGWSPNSDIDPIYQRLKDKDVSNNYLSNYGFTETEEEIEQDVVPQKCRNCKRLNVGYRISYLQCGKQLQTAHPDGIDYVDPDEEKIKAEGYQKGLEYKLENPDARRHEVLDKVEGKITELMEEEYEK